MEFVPLPEPLLGLFGLVCGRLAAQKGLGALVITRHQASRLLRLMHGMGNLTERQSVVIDEAVARAGVPENMADVVRALHAQSRGETGGALLEVTASGGLVSPLPYAVVRGTVRFTGVELWNLERAAAILHENTMQVTGAFTTSSAQRVLADLALAGVPLDPEDWDRRTKALPADTLSAWWARGNAALAGKNGSMPTLAAMLQRFAKLAAER